MQIYMLYQSQELESNIFFIEFEEDSHLSFTSKLSKVDSCILVKAFHPVHDLLLVHVQLDVDDFVGLDLPGEG